MTAIRSPKSQSSTNAQVGVDLLVSPPKPGDESYDLFHAQTTETLSNLKSRSLYMSERFNSLEGMSCVPADGAMYLLPKIDMPQKALQEAEKRGKKADVMYTLDMLGKSLIAIGRLYQVSVRTLSRISKEMKKENES